MRGMRNIKIPSVMSLHCRKSVAAVTTVVVLQLAIVGED